MCFVMNLRLPSVQAEVTFGKQGLRQASPEGNSHQVLAKELGYSTTPATETEARFRAFVDLLAKA
jgi:hypothetical protein